MSNRRRLERILRSKFREAGRQVGAAKHAYDTAREATAADLDVDDDGKVRIVCRRYAEKRVVDLDSGFRPDCFDPDHQDCVGCVEDIREGRIQTWGQGDDSA